MKKIIYFTVLIVSLFFVSCHEPFHSFDLDNPPPAGYGYFSMRLNDSAARNIVPGTPLESQIAVYELRFNSKTSTYDETFDLTDPTEKVAVPVGEYIFTVTAFRDTNKTQAFLFFEDDDLSIFAGTTTLTIDFVTFELDGVGTGSFTWAIELPSGLTEASITIQPIDTAKGSAARTINFIETGNYVDLNNIADPLELNSGYYRVLIVLERDDHQPFVHREALHVYQGMTSHLVKNFDNDIFNSLQYKVTFLYNNGASAPFDKGESDVSFGEKVNALLEPAKPSFTLGPGLYRGSLPTEYQFDGWFLNDTDNSPFNFDTDITGNVTLTARWSAPGRIKEVTDNNVTASVYYANMNAATGPYILLLNQTVDLNTNMDINANLTIQVLTPLFINRTGTGNLFTVGASGTLTLDAGLILNGHNANNASLVRINGGSFVMRNGSSIQNNTAENGGAVFLNSGTFNMYGGTIQGNTANNGGGVYMSNGVFSMYGGRIGAAANIDNNRNRAMNGGGVFINGGSFQILEDTAIIAGNDASENGGGVSVSGGGFYMWGGAIGGTGAGVQNTNTAQNNGGGVFVLGASGGICNLYNGTISNNRAATGGGISFTAGTGAATLRLGRTIKIINNTNTAGNAANNVQLGDGKYIILDTNYPPADGMDVSVQTATASGIIVNSGATTAQAAYFRADEDGKAVVHEATGRLVIADPVQSGGGIIITFAPQNLMPNVNNTLGTISISNNDIATLTISGTALTDIEWWLGSQLLGTGTSINIEAADHTPSSKIISLLAIEGGVPYSRLIEIIVVP
ncbi:MAG: hypothetical protein FWD24_01215 [Treponema sp.]|nr:hypothetical protein [Treponema sp.]